MLDEMPRNHIGMKARRTEIGMVRMGTIAEGMCQRKRRITRLTITICRTSSWRQGVDGPLDEVGAVVGRDDAHALGQRGLDLPETLAHALDHGARVLAVAHDHDPAHGVAEAVEIADPAADLGAERDLGHVAQQHRRPERVGAQDRLLEVGGRADVAPAADHVLLARHLDEPAAHLDVGAAHRLGHLHDPEAVGLEPVRVDRDLVLLLEAAEGGHLRDARHRLQAVAQRPVLERAQVGEAVLPRVVHEGVLEDPADAGGVRAHLGAHALGQDGLDLREVLDDAAAGPVDVGPVLEDHVDVAVAEVGEAADRLHLRRAEQRGDDRVGDLVLDDVGAAVPARVDDDLRVREVRDRVHRDRPQGVDGEEDERGRRQEDDPAVLRAPLDDGAGHGRLRGSRSMPQMRQEPGLSDVTSGCIGQA